MVALRLKALWTGMSMLILQAHQRLALGAWHSLCL